MSTSSLHSSESTSSPNGSSVCKICLQSSFPLEPLITACSCKGTMAYHEECLKLYMISNPFLKDCPECLTPFTHTLKHTETYFIKFLKFVAKNSQIYFTMVFLYPLLCLIYESFLTLFVYKFDTNSLLLFLIFSVGTLKVTRIKESTGDIIKLLLDHVFTVYRVYFTDVDQFAYVLLMIYNIYNLIDIKLKFYKNNPNNYTISK